VYVRHPDGPAIGSSIIRAAGNWNDISSFLPDDDDDDDGPGRRRRLRRRRHGRGRDVFRLRPAGTLTTTLSRSCSGPPPASATAAIADGRSNGSAGRRHATVVTTLLGRHRVRTRLTGDDDFGDDRLKESFV